MAEEFLSQCPVCLKKLEKIPSEQKIGYGQKIKKCPFCGHVYCDNSVKEIAELGFFPGGVNLKNEIFTSIIMLIIGIAATVGFVLSLMYSPYILRILALGPVLVVISIFKIIKDIVTSGKRNRLLKQEYEKSKARLANPDYYELFMKHKNGLPLN